jgi:hypothetical protein
MGKRGHPMIIGTSSRLAGVAEAGVTGVGPTDQPPTHVVAMLKKIALQAFVGSDFGNPWEYATGGWW